MAEEKDKKSEKKTKSSKLYSDSPKIGKDKEGKTSVKKPSEADAENMGISGNESPGAGDGMPVDVHQQERDDMNKRHERQIKEIHKHHEEEREQMNSRHKLSGTPAEAIEGSK